MSGHDDLRELGRTVANLAAPAEEQAAYLREFGTYPALDEFAVQFDDAYLRVPRLREAGLLDGSEDAGLYAIDSQLSAMTSAGDPALWQGAALEGAEWGTLRALAHAALATLPEPDTGVLFGHDGDKGG